MYMYPITLARVHTVDSSERCVSDCKITACHWSFFQAKFLSSQSKFVWMAYQIKIPTDQLCDLILHSGLVRVIAFTAGADSHSALSRMTSSPGSQDQSSLSDNTSQTPPPPSADGAGGSQRRPSPTPSPSPGGPTEGDKDGRTGNRQGEGEGEGDGREDSGLGGTAGEQWKTRPEWTLSSRLHVTVPTASLTAHPRPTDPALRPPLHGATPEATPKTTPTPMAPRIPSVPQPRGDTVHSDGEGSPVLSSRHSGHGHEPEVEAASVPKVMRKRAWQEDGTQHAPPPTLPPAGGKSQETSCKQ